MKKVEYWRWEMWSELGPRRRIKTRHHMTAAEALGCDPTAVPLPSSLQVRLLPECDEEVNHTSRHSQLAIPRPDDD